MNDHVEIVAIDAGNVDERGFFCYKSKPKTEGYRRKLAWLKQRFAEGMQIKIVYEGSRAVGFIEYVPGEFAWRPVDARGYMFIHCLWVVGRAKKKGYGSRLLGACVEDARRMGKQGVAAVIKPGGHLVGKQLFLKNGFEAIDWAPPTFELVAKKFGDAPSPAFPKNWEQRLARYGVGLTVFRSDQCPYTDGAVRQALEVADEAGVQARVIELKTAQDVQNLAPSAYSVFGLAYDGELLAAFPIGKRELVERLVELSTKAKR